MYSAKFVRDDDGKTFYFDYENGVIFDIDPLSEMDVNLDTSQGFQQIGDMIENQSVSGLTRQITGILLGDATVNKNLMLNVFLPFTSGKLYFNNKFFCDCVVNKTPAIATPKKDCTFTIVLFCSYPYWYGASQNQPAIGTYNPSFIFPVCYDSHIFGIMDSSAFTTIINQGNANAAIDVTFRADYTVSNFGIVNVNTLEILKINDTLHIGESVHVYRDGTNIYVEKTVDGVTEDAFALLDEDSNLFWLHPGENVIRAFSDDDQNIICELKYRDVWVGIYDGM